MKRKSIKVGIIACAVFTLLAMNTLPTFAANTGNRAWSTKKDLVNTCDEAAKQDNSCIYVYNQSGTEVNVSVYGYSGFPGHFGTNELDAGIRNSYMGQGKTYKTKNLSVPAHRECLIYNWVFENNQSYVHFYVRSTNKNTTQSGQWSPDSTMEMGHTYTYLN